MAQMTWRAPELLLARVRQQAQERGRSLNEWVTEVLSAASDPATAGSEADRIRERLQRAGLLSAVEPRPRRGSDPQELARARRQAGKGTATSRLVVDERA